MYKKNVFFLHGLYLSSIKNSKSHKNDKFSFSSQHEKVTFGYISFLILNQKPCFHDRSKSLCESTAILQMMDSKAIRPAPPLHQDVSFAHPCKYQENKVSLPMFSKVGAHQLQNTFFSRFCNASENRMLNIAVCHKWTCMILFPPHISSQPCLHLMHSKSRLQQKSFEPSSAFHLHIVQTAISNVGCSDNRFVKNCTKKDPRKVNLYPNERQKSKCNGNRISRSKRSNWGIAAKKQLTSSLSNGRPKHEPFVRISKSNL